MTFIPNVLGSGGAYSQVLGNLTSGLEAIQKAEIQRRIGEIQQQKAWERDDKLRNEAFALQMVLPKITEDMRVGLAMETAKKANAFTQDLTNTTTKAQNGGKPMSWEDKIRIATERASLVQDSEKAAAMIKTIDEGKTFIQQTLSKITDPNERDAYLKGIADFYVKLKHPVLSKDLMPIDYINAIQPPDPSFATVFAQTTKDLLPFVDNAVKAEANGRTSVDFNVLKKVIASNVDQNSYLYRKGVQEGKFKNVDQLYNQMAERIAPSIKTDVVGWKPNEPTEKERFGGFETRYKSSVNKGETTDAYVFDQWGTPVETSFTLPDGKVTSAKMIPLAVKNNGKLEGEFTVNQRVTSEPMSQGEAMLFKQQTGGSLLPKDENGMYSVSYNQPTKYTKEIPLSGDVVEKIKRKDPNAAKYIGELEPYPTRTGAKSKQESANSDIDFINEYLKKIGRLEAKDGNKIIMWGGEWELNNKEDVKDLIKLLKEDEANPNSYSRLVGFTEGQRRGIDLVAEKNKISREEAINALKAAGKLK